MPKDPCPFAPEVSCPIEEGHCLGCYYSYRYAGRPVETSDQLRILLTHAMIGEIGSHYDAVLIQEERSMLLDVKGPGTSGIKIVRSSRDDPLSKRIPMRTW